ncbi:MAG: hypothetical protein JNK81_04010 [Anaerolineales bacterium]|nr:hypothetical protein [Anaerolineales bacterium]
MQTQVPTENEIGNGTPQKSNRIWFIVGGILLACCCLTVLVAGAASAFYFMSAPSTSSVSESNTASAGVPKLEALITASELEPLSETIGIVGWTLNQETPGENRVCRTFQGYSWSAIPNEAMNCIYSIAPGTGVDEVGAEFLKSGQLFADEKPVTSTLSIPYEHIIYVGTYPTGHTVIDLLVIKDGLLYWSSVTVGTQPGVTPEENIQSYSSFIYEFLYEVVKVNFSKN